MPDPRKIHREFFEPHVRPNLGTDRDDVPLDPMPAVDVGLIDVGDRVVVPATDPVSILPTSASRGPDGSPSISFSRTWPSAACHPRISRSALRSHRR